MAVSLHLFPLFLVCLGVDFEIVRSEFAVLDHRVFLWQILEKYGQNGSIPFEGFERLYGNLGLGEAEVSGGAATSPALSRNSRNSDKVYNKTICKSQEELAKMILQHEEVPSGGVVRPPRSCLSVSEVLTIYGLPLGETMGPVTFLHLCPAIVYQLDQGTCIRHSEHGHIHTVRGTITQSSWMFACLSWLVISVSGLMIVAVVPLLQNTLVNQLITFLVALAVGTLLGDAFLHLIPHALMESQGSEEDNHTNSVMKTGLMFLTVVFFFTLESVLNTVRSNKEKHKPQEPLSYVAVSVTENENEKEMMELSKAAPKLEHSVASHGHGHSHSPQSNTALMVIMGEGLHKLTDGLAIGASFSGGLAPGFATAVAVFTHELPHELGDFAVLLQSGVPVRRALLYNLLSSALSLLGTVLGLVIGNFGDSTQWVYAITAGCFTYIALSNLVPEINRQKSDCSTVMMRLCGILSGGALMACIAVYEHDLQHLFS